MKERIIINDIEMDMSESKGISLVFQSQLFTDLDSIVSNRTNSVDFPVTMNNLKAIERADLNTIDSVYAYRRHRVLYIRDGIQIFSGLATLLSVTDQAIKFSFVWGNSSMFQKLLDLNLRDLILEGESKYVQWDDSGFDKEFFDYNINFGAGHLAHPIMPVSKIIEAMKSTSGISINDKGIFDKYVVPLVSKNADDYSRRESSLYFYWCDKYVYQPRVTGQIEGDYYLRFGCIIPAEEDKDPEHLYIGKGMYDVSEIDNLRIYIREGGWEVWTTQRINGIKRRYNYTSFAIYAVDEDGNNPKEIARIGTKKTNISEDGNHATYTVLEESDVLVNVEQYTHIVLCVNACSSKENPGFADFGFTLDTYYVRVYNNDTEEVPVGGEFPLWNNLPDWDCSKFLKNLMKIEGLNARVNGNNEIEFIGVDTLYDNRIVAEDWSERLIADSTIEKTFSFGSYAQKNICKYADDTTVKGNFNSEILISSEILDKEQDMITLDFAPTDSSFSGTPIIDAYTKDDEGNEEFTEVTPRILRYNDSVNTTFYGLGWKDIIREKYSKMSTVLNKQEVIKASFLLTSLQLSKIDLSVPVYISKFGKYYAVLKLTTKDDNIAEAELLALPPLEKEKVALPDKVKDLVVLNDGGKYVAAISSLTWEQTVMLKRNPDYKVCIVRYGYARRGKFFEYKDISGKETNSKTNRIGYREYRKKLKWRIIGEEQLVTGRTALHSQTLKYYGDSTLVFTLGDEIVLPPMRGKNPQSKSVNISKSGRIRNTDRNGIAELSIALFRKNEKNKWEMISNVCPVRGRTEDRTQLWEFEETNIVEVE